MDRKAYSLSYNKAENASKGASTDLEATHPVFTPIDRLGSLKCPKSTDRPSNQFKGQFKTTMDVDSSDTDLDYFPGHPKYKGRKNKANPDTNYDEEDTGTDLNLSTDDAIDVQQSQKSYERLYPSSSSCSIQDRTNRTVLNNLDVNNALVTTPITPVSYVYSQLSSKLPAHGKLVAIDNESSGTDDTIPTEPVDLENGYRFQVPSSPPMASNIPSSPLLESQTYDFSKPILTKSIHQISRNGTDLQPVRKKLKKPTLTKSLTLDSANVTFVERQIEQEFALDRDGHVYGYLLKSDSLPNNYQPKLYDEPTYFVVENQRELSVKVSYLLEQLFDNSLEKVDFKTNKLEISLKDLGLNSLPDQLFDFSDLLCYTNTGIIKPYLLIDASDNKLRSISPKLLTIKNLTMLSLRNNKIARLPGKIDHATNLQELNLGSNKFKFLPHNILNLNSLNVLALGHNNCMISTDNVSYHYEVDEELLVLSKDDKLLNLDKKIKHFGKIHWMVDKPKSLNKRNTRLRKVPVISMARSLTTLQDQAYDDNGLLRGYEDNFSNPLDNSTSKPPVSFTPKLTEIILRQISEYKISLSEQLLWKQSTPLRIYDKAMKALIYGTNGETCGVCENICIESCGEMLEWWDFKGSKSITIKRRFCSGYCGQLWWDKLQLIRKKPTGET